MLNDVPAVKCDVKLNEEIIQSVRELDSELKAYPTFHVMGSEDFSYFGEKIPTSYFFIGAGVDNQDEWLDIIILMQNSMKHACRRQLLFMRKRQWIGWKIMVRQKMDLA